MMKSIKQLIFNVSLVLIYSFLLNINIAYSDGTELVVAKGGVSGTIDTPPAIGVGEYTESGTISNGKGNFQIQTYRSGDGAIEEIQLYVEINDSTPDPNEDQIRLSFDLDHNHSATDFDRGIRIFRSLSGGATNNVRLTNINLFAEPTDQGDLTASQWSVDPGTTTWTAEVKIRASDLGLNFIPSILGMHIRVITFNQTPAAGLYPSGVNTSQIGSWLNLKTRNPLEYVLLLDQSGSMTQPVNINVGACGTYAVINSDWKWAKAKKAANVFAHVYHSLSTLYFADSIGLAKFTWDCSTNVDKCGTIKNLSTLESFSDINNYTDRPPGPDDYFGWTPIKSGLNHAFSMFSLGPNTEKIVLLMSDGGHYGPSFDYDEIPYIFPGSTGITDYQVNTVALGSDDDVGTDLLQSISSDFSGFGGSYLNAIEEEELTDSFVSNLFSHLYMNKVDVDVNGQFLVNLNEPRLLVMLVWNSTTAVDRGFRLKRPDNSIIGTGDPGYHHYKNTILDYEIAYYVVDSPSPTGTWQTISTSSMSPEVGDNNFALFDPTVYAFFSVKQLGDKFLLKAVLKENGVPISEPEASVVVTVEKPDEGLGTVLSTLQYDCTYREPALEPFDDIFTREGYIAANTDKSVVAAETQRAYDILPPHLTKKMALFKKCGKSGLDRSVNSELQLYDDGTHGDTVDGDGIFTLRYENTEKEGTYTFSFNASGKAPSGTNFSRVNTLAAHMLPMSSPNATVFDFRIINKVDNIVTAEYYVIPKSNANEYLGPGHKNLIQFNATSGEWLTNVNDYNNGIYSRVLQYDATQGELEVTAVVQGKPIKIRLRRFEIAPFVGYTYFDSSLHLDDGVVVGGRFGYRFTKRLILELEGGVTFTESSTGDSGYVIQTLLNGRYDVYTVNTRLGELTPYVTVGLGGIFFKGFGNNDNAFAVQGGAGATLDINESFGIRIDNRVFKLNDALGAGATTNYQITGGLVFRF